MKRLSWQFPQHMFQSAEFSDPIDVPAMFMAPYRDVEHYGIAVHTCLACASGPVLVNSYGLWKLRYPLNIPGLMPGLNRTLTSVTTKGGSVWQAGTIIYQAQTNLILVADGEQIFRATKLSHKTLPDYATNLFQNLNIGLDDVTSLDVWVEQGLAIEWGYAAHHDFDITLGFAYYSTAPIEVGSVTVEVTDREQPLIPVVGTLVRLLSGTRVMGEGYTDKQGAIQFGNIPVGNYTLVVYGIKSTIFRGGYAEETLVVSVWTGSNLFPVALTPLPPLPFPEIPWYVWMGIAVVGIGGAIYYFKPTFPRAVYERARREYPRVKEYARKARARIKRKR